MLFFLLNLLVRPVIEHSSRRNLLQVLLLTVAVQCACTNFSHMQFSVKQRAFPRLARDCSPCAGRPEWRFYPENKNNMFLLLLDGNVSSASTLSFSQHFSFNFKLHHCGMIYNIYNWVIQLLVVRWYSFHPSNSKTVFLFYFIFETKAAKAAFFF